MDARADKKRLRAEARAARAALSAEERAERSRAIAERALALPEVAAAEAALAYGATPEEADPAPLLAELRARGARIALPRVERELLTMHWVASDGDLEAGAFGLRQPRAESPLAAAEEIGLVIVPGVAFDEHGARLGYGAGYYDRLLPLLEGAPRVALAFDEQVYPALPVESHDVPIDIIVTPTRAIRPTA